jgi:hypothetical protein
MNRWRLSIALAAALIPLAVPAPAHAASGSFVYWSSRSDGSQDGMRHQLNDPATDRCTPLVGDDQQVGTEIYKVENETDTPATVYQNTDCTGHRLIVPPRATRTAGGHGPSEFNSVKFRAS